MLDQISCNYCCIFFAFFTTFQLSLLKFSGWQMIKIVTDSIMHYIWQCPKVQEFWQQVGRWLEEIFEIPIQLNIEF
jgi:hypothetical protein